MTSAGSRAVCPMHVQDTALRARIQALATESSCSYCAAAAATPIAADFDAFIEAFLVGVGVYYQPHPATDAAVLESGDVAREILDIAGVTHQGLAADVAAELSAEPTWTPRDRKSGSGIDQLTYSWRPSSTSSSTRCVTSSPPGPPGRAIPAT